MVKTNDIGDGYSELKTIAAEVANAVIISNRKEMVGQHDTRVRVPETFASGQTSNVFDIYDDDSRLNRIRRCGTKIGVTRKISYFLNCNKCLKISTMNVRTIRTQRLREELVCNTITEKADVLGIQKHRMLHTEDMKYETVNEKTLITSSAWRNDSGAATGEVEILLNSKSKKALYSVIMYNERIILINLAIPLRHLL